jgi:hypothetical protein
MNVEVVTDKMPTSDLLISGNDSLDMCQEIILSTRGSTKRGQKLSGDDIAAQNEAPRAMSLVLEFLSRHMAWYQRQSGVFAFQGLNAGQLIGTHGAFSLLGQRRCIVIDPTDGSDDCIFLRIGWWGEPIADEMGLEIPLFKRRAAWRGEICWMMPRSITSSAISRPVQCVMDALLVARKQRRSVGRIALWSSEGDALVEEYR